MKASSSSNGWKITLAVAAIGAIATIGAAFIANIGGTKQNADPGLTMPSASSTCPGSLKTHLDADLTDDNSHYTIQVFCPPPPRSHYVLISQAGGADVNPENPHNEYYITLDMKEISAGPNDYPNEEVDGYIKDGKKITCYVISVDDSDYAQLLAARVRPEGPVLELPVGHQVVSNPVTIQGKR